MYTPEQEKWITAAHNFGGSFIKAFATACSMADSDNTEIIKLSLNVLMLKYPQYSDPLYQRNSRIEEI